MYVRLFESKPFNRAD